MNITLSPQRADGVLIASKEGDAITLNGDTFDFSELADGESVPSPTRWISGPISRVDGAITLTLVLPIEAGDQPPELAFPEPIVAKDGLVALPRRERIVWKITRAELDAAAADKIADEDVQAKARSAARKAELLELLRSDDIDIRAALASMAQLEVNEDRASQKEMLNTDPVGK